MNHGNELISDWKLIGRDEQWQAIMQTIQELKDSSRSIMTFCLVARGGIGKTRLLREISERRDALGIRCANIIDFDDITYHSPEALMQILVERLDETNSGFTRYREVAQNYETQRASNRLEATPATIIHNLTEAFKQGYNALLDGRPIVLLFDTMERLYRQPDEFQEKLKITEVQAQPSILWLQKVVSDLRNTFLLFAGRDQPGHFQQHLEKSFQHVGKVTQIEIEAFKLGDTEKYLKYAAQRYPDFAGWLSDPTLIELVHTRSGGLPVYLALAVDYIRKAPQPESILDQLQHSVTLDEVWSNIIETLIAADNQNFDLQQSLHLLLLARKGLTPELLQHYLATQRIESDSPSYWDILSKFEVVRKTNAGMELTPLGKQLTFHDELYYHLENSQFMQDHMGNYLDAIISHYRGLIALPGWTRTQQDTLERHQLYYLLRRNPHEGWRSFNALMRNAINARNLNHLIQVREEFVSFYTRYAHLNAPFYRTQVGNALPEEDVLKNLRNYDIQQLYVEEEYHKIDERVTDLLGDENGSLYAVEDFELRFFQAQSLTHLGDSRAEIILANLRSLLDQTHLISAARQEDLNLYQQHIGMVENAYGYYYRTQGRYLSASRSYRKALAAYEQISGEIGRNGLATAQTNLAFVLAQLGDTVLARRYSSAAVRLREPKSGVPLVLALGAQVYAEIAAHNFKDAISIAESRVRLAEALQYPRSLVLALTTAGLAHRKMADRWKYSNISLEEAEFHFQEAKRFLLRAYELYKEYEINEPLRLWEILSELGSTYCDWAYFRWKALNDLEGAFDFYEESTRYTTLAKEATKGTPWKRM